MEEHVRSMENTLESVTEGLIEQRRNTTALMNWLRTMDRNVDRLILSVREIREGNKGASENSERKIPLPVKCFQCGQMGHIKVECPQVMMKNLMESRRMDGTALSRGMHDPGLRFHGGTRSSQCW